MHIVLLAMHIVLLAMHIVLLAMHIVLLAMHIVLLAMHVATACHAPNQDYKALDKVLQRALLVCWTAIQ